jgi:hypothetical protein
MANADKELVLDQELAAEAKAIAVLAFRNGPLEDIHAGQECPTCSGKIEYSHITQDEMKRIMKNAVNKIYALLWTRTHCPDVYPSIVGVGARFAGNWDPPERSRQEIEQLARMADLLAGVRGGPGDASLVRHKSRPRAGARKKNSS